jgi:hypothetical protein
VNRSIRKYKIGLNVWKGLKMSECRRRLLTKIPNAEEILADHAEGGIPRNRNRS